MRFFLGGNPAFPRPVCRVTQGFFGFGSTFVRQTSEQHQVQTYAAPWEGKKPAKMVI
jgi:hypothetical protein